MRDDLKIEYLSPALLKRNPRNARLHPPQQKAKLLASVRLFGFSNPILIDEHNNVIAGHGRLDVAFEMNLTRIPVIRIRHLNEAQKRALAIADNKIALGASWDLEILGKELEYLLTEELDFGPEITGFETAEIDLIIDGQINQNKPDEAGSFPAIDPGQPAVTRRGNIWFLGNHCIICGDALDPETYRQLLSDKRVHMVFLDPPYNLKIQGHVGGRGKIKYREFPMGCGEMTFAQFTEFLETVFRNIAQVSAPGALIYSCIDWRHLREAIDAGVKTFGSLKNLICWIKISAGMGSFYRSQHELILLFKCGTAPHTNNISLGKFGRNRSNVWTYAGVNSFKRGRLDELSVHPTVKPISLVADAIRDCTKRGQIIFDTFGGSGTTLLAAERTGRHARLLELDPLYVDVTVRRWQKMTGDKATLASDGRTFDEIAAGRTGYPQRRRLFAVNDVQQ